MAVSSSSGVAEENGYNCIVTGHTASDRAETSWLPDSRQADGLQA